MNILSIDEIISRYSHSVKKAERLNTTGNRHYEEKKSVIYYLKLLMSYISPGGALAVANPANPGEYMPESDIFLSPVHEAAYKARVGECEAGNITDNAAATDGSITINSATLTNECNRLLFDSINAVLGIELMEWQKVYILTGRKARQGEATALALRQLLNNTAQPIDLTDKAAGYYFAGTDEELDRFKDLESDMSYDWFTDYFQEQHSNRDSMMQDFTPKELCRLLPMLADEYDSVADVCCGTGGLTIAAWNKNPQALFYCEELSTRAFPLLLFNLAIRNITAVAVNKDVLKNEIYGIYKVEGGRVIRFMEYGYPPTQFADYGFILHALSLLKDNGRIYAILPHGILFSGNREEQIREKLINNRMWISVIGLPDKLFKNTSIPVCVCVFGTNKDDGILFADSKII